MKKLYLWMSFLISFTFASAQTYCTPTGGSSSTSYYIGQATLSGTTSQNYTATSYQVYVDNSAQMVQTYAGAVLPIYIKQNSSTGKFYIYVDWNKDGDFDDAGENPLATTVYTADINATVTVPAAAALGNYRIRLESAYIDPTSYSACGPNPWGNFVDYTINVTNPPSCISPTALVNSAVTATTATVSWSAPSSVPANGYEVYATTSTVAPTAATVPTLSNVTGTTANLTGLTPASTTYVYVRSNCSASDKSGWSIATSFLTQCTVVTSFTQNFDTTSTSALPTCWEQIGTTGYVTTIGGSNISSPNLLTLSGNTFSGSAFVKLPSVSTLQLGTYRLKFKLIGQYSIGGKVEVGYLTDLTDPSTFVGIDAFTANSTSVADNIVVNNITAPAGIQNLVLRQTDTPGISVNMDDFVYELIPSCPEPGSLVTSNISTNTVDLTWTTPPSTPGNGYQIYYSTSNVAPTSATPAILTGITATNTTVSGLTPSTTYYMYVRSNCSATDKSPWVNAAAFTTACVPITTLPWTENFDALVTLGSNILPNCWKSLGGGGTKFYTSSNAGSNSDNDPRSAPNYATIYYPTTAASLWTPGFTLTAGQSYDFSFYWAGDNTAGWQGDILVNTTQSETGATALGTPFVLPATTTTSAYNQAKNTFIPTTTGTYYFAVKSFASTFAPNYLGFDDFKLESTPACADPTNITATAIMPTTATIGWTAPASIPANGYQYVVSTSNVTPTAAGTPTTATSIPLTGLTPATVYYVFVRSMCASGQSTWGTFSFTTAATPPVNDACSAPTVLTPGLTFTSNAVVGTFAAADTDTPLDCGFASGSYNVWYSVVVPSNGDITIATDSAPGSTVTDTVIQVFSGTCGTLTAILCDDDGGTDAFSQVVLNSSNGITPGQTLLVSVWKYGTSAAGTTPTFQISAFSGSLGTNDIVKTENAITVYPNPFTDFIRISDVKDVVSVSIVDLSGKLVKTMKPAKELNLSELNAGMYLINLKMKDGSVKTVKAIKK